ncbi:ABC transporter [Actinophytocola xinjiangensis]|uniref:Transport permease protein n=1 Tax=Actinophytocola xinjiangensis TaxID=485602 RepID=A0A7Z0WQF5_9PSEU|nr:ABC transporter permease [Actinophytocola xinjiangensis]OLF12224.1 ABC transporter [Actinophytocola xinjiangensis]
MTTALDTPVLSPRVRPVEGLRQSASLSWRTLVQIKHNPMELIDYSIQPIMFLLLFTYVFGGAISGSPGDYLTFALPGIIVQNALFGTLNTGIGLNTDVTKGVFDRLRTLPIARWAPLSGRIAADMVKQLWSMGLLLGLGAVMGFRIGTSPAGALGAVVLVLVLAMAFSWLSVLVSMLVSEPEKVMIFGMAVMFPLTFVSNAFVPVDTMPSWLRGIVDVNPVTLVADAVRGLLVGGPVAGPVTGSLLWAAGILVVVAPLAVRAFRRRV